MAFGAFQQGKSYRSLWQRSKTRTPPAGRGAASLVLGSDAFDEAATLQAGDKIEVAVSGDVNDAKRFSVRGVVRLNEAPPTGYGWRVSIEFPAYTDVLDFTATVLGDINYPYEFDISDRAYNIAGLGAGVTVTLGLELIEDTAAPGGTGVDVDVLLPSVYFDQILAPETIPSELYIADRLPPPGGVDVPPTLPAIVFKLCDTNGAGVDLSNTTVTIDGTIAYSGGAFQNSWTGAAITGVGPTSSDVLMQLLPPAGFLPYASEQIVEVNVVSQLNGPASPIDETWVFTAADTIPPAVQTAVMLDKLTLRVKFTDDVLLDASTYGALNPDNYAVVRLSAPAVSLDVVSVAAVSGKTDTVDLTFDIEASQGAQYAIAADNVKDTSGNVLDANGRETRFLGFQPARPAGRRFDLLDFVPDYNLEDDRTAEQGAAATDAGTGDLRNFILVLQDIADLLLCQIDEWSNIVDIDLAPEPFLDAILQDLGNPFADCIDDLTVNDKRRLARILISIYKQKGTAPGVINTIRFFLGVEVTLDIINYRAFWQLGISSLGVSTTLAPPVGSPLWYSFYIESPVVLTDEQRRRILCIADYMKPAHEHILGIIEPGNVITPSDYWILNESLLGATSAPATILA